MEEDLRLRQFAKNFHFVASDSLHMFVAQLVQHKDDWPGMSCHVRADEADASRASRAVAVDNSVGMVFVLQDSLAEVCTELDALCD